MAELPVKVFRVYSIDLLDVAVDEEDFYPIVLVEARWIYWPTQISLPPIIPHKMVGCVIICRHDYT